MGGEFGREWIHVHIQLSPFAVHLKLSQRCLLIGYTLIQNKTFSKKIFKGLAFTCPCILSSSNPTEVLVQNQEYHSCTIPSPLGQQRPYNSSGFHSLAKKKKYIYNVINHFIHNHGISQSRILEWVAISFSRGSSGPRDWTWVSCIAGRFFTNWATRETPLYMAWGWSPRISLIHHKEPGCSELMLIRITWRL